MKKILLVKNDPTIRNSLKRKLEFWGYQVVATKDGIEALEYFETERFAFMITDWIMPGMEGTELIKKIRALPGQDYTYIIMLTSKSDKKDFIKAMQAGTDDLAMKPVDMEELRARLIAGERVLKQEERMVKQNQELRFANQRMKMDLEAAAVIQRSLLPDTPPPVDNIKIAWNFIPSYVLAGDTFNVFNLDENHIGMYLLDVSGHGVPSALLAVTLSRMLSPIPNESSIIKQLTSSPPYYKINSPAEVANHLNKQFQLDPKNSQYFTLIYAVLNIKSLEFRFVSAGHPEIIHLSGKNNTRIVEAHDLPIGIVEDQKYQVHSITLNPGDRIYMYSDGITESANRNGELFGTVRLSVSLQKNRDYPLDISIQNLTEQSKNWCAPQPVEDDISILALEVQG